MTKAGLFLLGLLLFVSGCAGQAAPTEPPGVVNAFTGNCGTVTGPLRLSMWADEAVPEVLAAFEQRYGIKVTHDTYSSNEELIERLEQGARYDLVFPSDYAVQILVEQERLEPLALENIPNRKYVTNQLAYYYDPLNRYSLPFQWGTSGIAYNSTYIKTPPTSWAMMFDPAFLEAHNQKITMLDDKREVIGAALLAMGYSVNDADPNHLQEAQALLLTQQPRLNGYDTEQVAERLVSEEIYLAHSWSGMAALAASENAAIRYVIPEEGGVIWVDNMVIPKGATAKCTAELFMNFVLDPPVAAQISSHTFYNSPVPGAEPLLDPATLEVLNRGFLLDDSVIGRLEWIEYAEGAERFTELWEAVRQP
ncbi:MAG: spermidine/putrescine ABC transporter substrate-binding protein [Ardenticatenales bacterium]|nr:spermidine/putrescine ABC transporter substrate-binding protein [Ardenticatenales bacterium]